MENLYFLASQKPQNATERLCLMKVQDDIDGNPYIAFSSIILGEQMIHGRNLGDYFTLINKNALTNEETEKIENNGALLFEQSEQVAEYLLKNENFDFSSITVLFK